MRAMALVGGGAVPVVYRVRQRQSRDVVFSSARARRCRSPMHEDGSRLTAQLDLVTLVVAAAVARVAIAAVVVRAPELLAAHCLTTSMILEARVMVETRVITNQSRRAGAALTQVRGLRKQLSWLLAASPVAPGPSAPPNSLPTFPHATGIRRRARPPSKHDDGDMKSGRAKLGASDRGGSTYASTAWNTWRWVIVVLVVVLLLAVMQPPEEAGLTGIYLGTWIFTVRNSKPSPTKMNKKYET